MRAVVTVATGRYQQGMKRLTSAIQAADENFMFYGDLPPDSPPHEQMPYAFKAFALADAVKRGATQLLWLDASTLPIAPLEPIWQRAIEWGAWFSKNWWNNYHWTADLAYKELFPGLNLESARVINRNIWHVAGTAFALDLEHPNGKRIFDRYLALARGQAFLGPWWNQNNPEVAHRPHAWPCGPADVIGHRHDQTALSVLAWENAIPLTDPPAFFAYKGGESADTIIMVDGSVNTPARSGLTLSPGRRVWY